MRFVFFVPCLVKSNVEFDYLKTDAFYFGLKPQAPRPKPYTPTPETRHA
jgi:hypothetical protein